MEEGQDKIIEAVVDSANINYLQAADDIGPIVETTITTTEKQIEVPIADPYSTVEEQPLPGVKKDVDDYQQLQEFLSNPKNQSDALNMAAEICEMMGDNWFTITRYARKSKLNVDTAFQKLKTLEMFDLTRFRIGDFKDGKESLRLPMFKITITNQQRRDGIDRIIQYYQEQIDQLTIQKNLLVIDKP